MLTGCPLLLLSTLLNFCIRHSFYFPQRLVLKKIIHLYCFRSGPFSWECMSCDQKVKRHFFKFYIFKRFLKIKLSFLRMEMSIYIIGVHTLIPATTKVKLSFTTPLWELLLDSVAPFLEHLLPQPNFNVGG